MEIADRYRLVERRGHGGIGEVWEAVDSTTGQRVAIKLLLPVWQSDWKIRQRFIREGRLASSMQHRNVVAIHDVGEADDGQPYIAMELLEGPSLEVEIGRSGPMSWDRVKRALLQLCCALDHAHGLGVVHRDVKPSNVMLAPCPGSPDLCKLVDFGIAKASLVEPHIPNLTVDGQVLGSPGFMSPEQLQGRPTDHRGDIYGLGCTGYYLLAGRLPFDGGSVPEVVHNALYHGPRALDGVNLDERLRRDVEALLHRAMQRDPDRRFGSVLDFVVALNNVYEPSLLSALPTGARAAASREVEEPPQDSEQDQDPEQDQNQDHRWLLDERPTVGRATWADPEGLVELACVRPHVIMVHMSGVIESAEQLPSRLGELLERHRDCHVFWHIGSVEGFPAEARDALLRTLTEHRDCIESAHVLNGRGLVGMALSLSAMGFGSKWHVYEDHASWHTALDG